MSVPHKVAAPTNEDGVVLFAKRRPDWVLPECHKGLKLSNAEQIDDSIAGTRLACPSCGRSRAMYCYDCKKSLTSLAPMVTLPFAFSIITHQDEQASKNTGVQAAVLAPGMVQLHDLDHMPPCDPARTVVLFPSDDACAVGDLEPGSIDRAIIIDSKWKKAKELIKHPAIKGMRRVKLAEVRTAFWRFHTEGVADEGVCTIEAMWQFLAALASQGKLSAQQPAQPQETTPEAEEVQNQANGAAATAAAQEATGAAATGQATTPVDATQNQQGAATGGLQGAGAVAGSSRKDWSDPHAFDDLLWFFVQQHKHIQDVAARRLETRKAARQAAEQGDGKPQKKQKHGNGGAQLMPAAAAQPQARENQQQEQQQQGQQQQQDVQQ